MAVEKELVEFLTCPKSRGALKLVDLNQKVSERIAERFREYFRDEEPVVQQGLYCDESQLVYPIVSNIPIMLEDEAFPASDLEAA